MSNIVKTQDGSNTLFSTQYNQHYHNINDGAINETLTKHIIPCINYQKHKKSLNILDICFGLGYNAFATIFYVLKNNLDIKLNIFSPELDEELINSLENFEYPNEFESIKNIIKTTIKNKEYKSENINIKIFVGEARQYIKSFENDFFDIIYQDAFSSEVNSTLWTKQYFDEIFKVSKESCILSTYSIASSVRLSMHEAGFEIYEYIPIKRKITLCFKTKQKQIGKYIDMNLKKSRNKELKALYD